MIPKNEYGTEDIQNELLDLMKRFHQFCEKRNISYSLFGGSCLGAIRHNGFIPWDDDLDICMNRYNYERLLKEFDNSTGLNMHQTIWIKRIQKEGAVAIRDYVPTLDVFVIDNVPDSKFLFRWKIFRLSMLQGMLKEEVSYEGFSFVNKVFIFVTHIMGKLFSVKRLRKWYDNVSKCGNKETTKKVHCTNTSYRWLKNRYPSKTWDEVVLHSFEDADFYVPASYDEYLKICYGDYTRLPDETYRIPEHVRKGE